jgi:osmotically-inducible protein OsmY
MAYHFASATPYSRYYYGAYGPYHARTVRSDEELQSEVRNRLVWDDWVDAGRIGVEVRDGVVTLTGEVDTIVEKRAAGDDAWDAPGIVDVANHLRVRRPARR